MNLLQLQNGSKSYGPRILFDDASVSVNDDEHIGLIGPNGAGKSTLFKVLVGKTEMDSGKIIRSQSLRIAYLEQESDWDLDQTAETFLMKSSKKPLWELKLKGDILGLKPEDYTRNLKSFSGGYRMRFKLLQLLSLDPNLMLLDEPTNFLDLETVLVLEKFLQSFEGAYLLISHDREFLRRTTDHIIEIEQGDIFKFPGNIDDYFEQKALIRTQLEQKAMNVASKRKTIMDFVDRFGAKATKARQAQSRLKLLDKLEQVEIKALPVKAKINIPTPIATGKEAITTEMASWGYSGKAIISGVTLRLLRGDHLGIVGFNGAGKSTLLKGLAGLLPTLNGKMNWGHEVKIGYFAQHSADSLDPEDTVLESLQKTAHSSIKNQEILNLAGSLLFSGDDILKKIRVLSGGEKSRVALGQILLLKAPVLLLDEPTNHLDFDTVEALTQALNAYEGSLIVISHDRGFIARVATKILEIKNGRAEFYPGNYEEYLWSLENGMLADRNLNFTSSLESIVVPEVQIAPPMAFNFKNEQRRLEKEIVNIKKSIRNLETQLKDKSAVQSRLTEDLIKLTGPQAKEVAIQLNIESKSILDLEDQLLQNLETLDGFEKDLDNLNSSHKR